MKLHVLCLIKKIVIISFLGSLSVSSVCYSNVYLKVLKQFKKQSTEGLTISEIEYLVDGLSYPEIKNLHRKYTNKTAVKIFLQKYRDSVGRGRNQYVRELEEIYDHINPQIYACWAATVMEVIPSKFTVDAVRKVAQSGAKNSEKIDDRFERCMMVAEIAGTIEGVFCRFGKYQAHPSNSSDCRF